MAVSPPGQGGLSPDDRRLLEALIAELGPRLFAYVSHLARHAQDAEDIVAETFCRAAANMEAVRATDRRDLYFVTIARNLCRDRIRRAQNRTAPPGLRTAWASAPGSSSAGRSDGNGQAAGDPAAALNLSENLAALRTAVDELPESLREVVILRLATDLRFEDIAELLNVPLGTALSRMHAAVAQLRRRLGVDV
jgi:RNA polymerase sigma factor (sigma-70 family)